MARRSRRRKPAPPPCRQRIKPTWKSKYILAFLFTVNLHCFSSVSSLAASLPLQVFISEPWGDDCRQRKAWTSSSSSRGGGGGGRRGGAEGCGSSSRRAGSCCAPCCPWSASTPPETSCKETYTPLKDDSWSFPHSLLIFSPSLQIPEEFDIDSDNSEDCYMCPEYAKDIFDYLKQREVRWTKAWEESKLRSQDLELLCQQCSY